MESRKKGEILKKLFGFLQQRKQKIEFAGVLVILAVSAGLSQVTPIAVEYLTNSILEVDYIHFETVVPVLLLILIANVSNETIKVIRRLMVEDTATYIEKSARQKATQALLKAPLMYFRSHMTGNIHGRLNRNLEGTSRLIKLIFMDFAPGGERNRSNHCDFCKASGNGSMHCNSCNSSWDVYCFPSDFHTERHPGGTDEYKGGHGWHYGGTAWRY